MDVIVKNALLPDHPETMDIGIFSGRIVCIAPKIRETAPKEIDARGCMVSAGFVDPHVHMDKCLLLERLGDRRDFSTLEKRIAGMKALKRSFTPPDVKARTIQAARMAVANGTTTSRTHVEADPIVEHRCVEGVLAAKETCCELMDIQTIAFPQEGWIENEAGTELESRPYIVEAMKKGMDVVGGNVNRAIWDSEPEQQVDELFEIAGENDADIDIHCDNSDNAVAFTLPYIAKKTMKCGFQGRVTVSHIPSLAAVPDRVARKTIDLIKEARINVCVLPLRIQLTRVKELMEAGVNVTCGTDNMQDAFVGLGNADPLNALLLLAQITKMGFDDQLEKIYRMGTVNAARALGIEKDYGVAEGKQADLVVLEARSIPEAIRSQAGKRAVIKNGKLVAENGRLMGDCDVP